MKKKSISDNYFAHFKAVCHDLVPHTKAVTDPANVLRPLKAAFPRVLALLQLTLTLSVVFVKENKKGNQQKLNVLSTKTKTNI